MDVDIAIIQETKLTGCIYTRFSSGYTVVATDAPSAHQGGIALCVRENDIFEVEETKIWHPNVLSFELVTGVDRYFVVGCYIPPDDLVPLDHIKTAWKECPKGCKPLLVGDMNIDLEYPRDERDEKVAEQCDFWNLTDMSRQFSQRRRRKTRGRWTWRQQRLGRWVQSHPDYFLAKEGSRRIFRNVALRRPRHHDTDHRAVVATLFGGSVRTTKAYRRRRQRFPIQLPPTGPRTEMESIFEELKHFVEKPPERKRPANNWISDGIWALIDHRARSESRAT